MSFYYNWILWLLFVDRPATFVNLVFSCVSISRPSLSMYQVRDDDYSEISVSENNEDNVDNFENQYQCGNVSCAVGILILYDMIMITPLMIGYDNLNNPNKTNGFLVLSSMITALWAFLIIVNALVMLLCRWGRDLFCSLVTTRVFFSIVLMIVYIGFYLSTPEWQHEKSLLFVFIVYIILLFACAIQLAVSMSHCFQ
jgi:magnesium-transporting ATPase (P-type)